MESIDFGLWTEPPSSHFLVTTVSSENRTNVPDEGRFKRLWEIELGEPGSQSAL